MKDCNDKFRAPLGESVEDWRPPPRPHRRPIEGAHCIVEPLRLAHCEELHRANMRDIEQRNWAYLPYGPFANVDSYRAWVADFCLGDDPMFFCIIDRRSGCALGVASFLRINPHAGSVEVGHIHYSPQLQRSVIATEAMFLMMREIFALGYRRYEWKCNALNETSRAAALRLGFTFEGIFRQMMVVKGRNRDSAWYSVIDKEWPALRRAFLAWLSPQNFDEDGAQRKSLAQLRAEVNAAPPGVTA